MPGWSRRSREGSWRAGEIQHFTGIDDPYEAPVQPEVHLRTDRMSLDEEVATLMAALRERGLLSA